MQATLTIRQEAVPIVKSSLETRRKALEFSLRQYRTRLSGFEQQHEMASEQFAVRFNAGELGDDAAWFEWEFVLDAARETERQLELVKRQYRKSHYCHPERGNPVKLVATKI